MRKVFWIILALFAAIVVPNANADPITDASVTRTFKFKCCNGVTDKIIDLSVTIDLPATGNPPIQIVPTDPTCKPSYDNAFTATLTCGGDGIVTSDTVIESVTVKGTSAPKIVIATWSLAKGGTAPATPIPEPATIRFLLGTGILFVVFARKRLH